MVEQSLITKIEKFPLKFLRFLSISKINLFKDFQSLKVGVIIVKFFIQNFV